MFEKHADHRLLPILMTLQAQSENNYIVGGAVRDLLSDKIPNDYDIVTDVPLDTLLDVFQQGGFTVTKTGTNFLVLNVFCSGYEVEVANFRKDTNCDGRHATCEVGTIEDDAFRRDFTINALYMNTRTGEVLDPTGQGLDDVRARVLRFVGKPRERITEDYLRVFRFYRFLNKGYVPDKKSLKAVRELWNDAYANTTAERVRNEMEKMVGLK